MLNSKGHKLYKKSQNDNVTRERYTTKCYS